MSCTCMPVCLLAQDGSFGRALAHFLHSSEEATACEVAWSVTMSLCITPLTQAKFSTQCHSTAEWAIGRRR
ncbi:hypothetical protein BDV25DRAFT_157128 [Aspergillus avenaceus]|uniref:Uncharacterized protein n=1 Tax=Aspergillus avenaceus TaxID=36643 RepID=A0A5N6TRQ7_ASPAV|nr:hypothetical protein BDV25DRAFT_157128 [Aspergillus avenaceus]